MTGGARASAGTEGARQRDKAHRGIGRDTPETRIALSRVPRPIGAGRGTAVEATSGPARPACATGERPKLLQSSYSCSMSIINLQLISHSTRAGPLEVVMTIQISNFHVSDRSKIIGSGKVALLPHRKDIAHSGIFVVKVDVVFDPAVNDYPTGSVSIDVDLSDSFQGKRGVDIHRAGQFLRQTYSDIGHYRQMQGRIAGDWHGPGGLPLLAIDCQQQEADRAGNPGRRRFCSL